MERNRYNGEKIDAIIATIKEKYALDVYTILTLQEQFREVFEKTMCTYAPDNNQVPILEILREEYAELFTILLYIHGQSQQGKKSLYLAVGDHFFPGYPDFTKAYFLNIS